MIMSIILFVGMYPCIFLIYYFLQAESKKKGQGLLFGVGITSQQREDAEVQTIIHDYQKRMKHVLLIFSIIPFVTFLIPYFSISFTVWMMWLILACFFLEQPIAIANKKLKNLKMQRGWYQSEEKQAESAGTIRVELSAVTSVRQVKPATFLLPMIISIAVSGVAFVKSVELQLEAMGICTACFGLITILFYLVAVWMDKMRSDVVSMNSEVNVNFSRAKKRIWKNFWLSSAWLNTVYTILSCVWIFLDIMNITALLWGTLVYTVVLFGIMIVTFKKQNTLQNHYKSEMQPEFANDDDMHWIWGIFYYNKKDRRTMVPTRVGMGTTTNLATPAGKAFEIFAALAILLLPICCIWVMMIEFTPMKLAIKDQYLVAAQLHEDYRIPMDEIENIQMITELPRWSKSSGTAMGNLEIGTFYIREVGKCQVFLNPENSVFFTFEYNGKDYYMGAETDEETIIIYHDLIEYLDS